METMTPAEEAELDRILRLLEPLDVAAAAIALKEVKAVFDAARVVFFLRQGTCLGAVREQAFIPWDDDVDVGSVIGLHGFTEDKVAPLVKTFRSLGFLTRIERLDQYLYVPLVKPGVRIDWCIYHILDDAVFMYPASRIPIRFLTEPAEIDFLGDRYCVPNPPEEYLETKYGPDWRTPKRAGDYEEDILQVIPETVTPGRAGKLKQFLARHLLWWRVTRINVLDDQGKPAPGAEISVAGLGITRTDANGEVRLYLPRTDHYALVVSFGDHRGILYVEWVAPGARYTYRPGEEHLLPV